MFISKTNENHFQLAQYGCPYEIDLIKVHKLESAPFMIYLMLKNKLSLSMKNGEKYHDNKGYFINYSQTSLGVDVHMTPKTVAKWMNHLKDKGLIDYDHDIKGKSYRIRIVAYEIQYTRKIKPYDSEYFDLDKAIKDLTAEKQALMDEKIALMDEINKLKKQIELQKRCLSHAEKITDDNNNITGVPMSTLENITDATPVNFTDELSIAIISNLKTSFIPSILKDIENTIKSSISQELNLKHDRKNELHTSVSNSPEVQEPIQEQYHFVSEYYRDLMGYYDLIMGADDKTCRIIDTFFENIMDMHFSTNFKFKGSEISRDRVRAVLGRMSYFQMDALIKKYMELTVKIGDHNSYIKSLIYDHILKFDAETHNDFMHGEHEYHKKNAEKSQSQDKQPQRNANFWDNLGTLGVS